MKKIIPAVVLSLTLMACSAKTTNANYSPYTSKVNNLEMSNTSVLTYVEQVRNMKSRKQLMHLMHTLESSEHMRMLPQEYYTHPRGHQLVQVNSIKKLNKDFFKMIGYSDEEAEQKMQAEWDIEQRIGTTSLNQMENRDKILASASLEDLKSYVELQIIRTYSGYLFNA